jgi:hypothetical protein
MMGIEALRGELPAGEATLAGKLFVYNILPANYSNAKSFRRFHRKMMILKDRG